MIKGLRLRHLKREAGQALALVAVTLPLFFVIALVVVDGSQGFVAKRQMQNAADAASLAAAREVVSALEPSCLSSQPCFTNAQAKVAAKAGEYAVMNGLSPSDAITAPSGPPCNPSIPPFSPANCALPPCDASHTTNCFTWPYPSDAGPGTPSRGRVEVRLQATVSTFFTNVADIAPAFLKASARAVASATGIPTQHCVFTSPVPNPDQYLNTSPPCTIPGTANQTGTVVPGVAGAEAFIMKPVCDAISYSGAGGGTIGAFATNGGLTFSGSGNKKVDVLGYDKTGCTNLNSAPNGDPAACTAALSTACVKNLVDLGAGVPFPWPVTPPSVPSAVQAPTVPTYPTQCTQLNSVFTVSQRSRNNNDVATLTTSTAHDLVPGEVVTVSGVPDSSFNGVVTVINPGASTFTYASAGPRVTTRSSVGTVTGGNAMIGNGWAGAQHPPGIYCLTGTAGTLTIANADLTAGDGYTFFAPKIDISGGALKFYWPSSQGPRPTTRPGSGYDSMTVLYASSATGSSDILIQGSGASLTGDIFVPNPSVFPPTSATVGGNIFIAGGAVDAGAGFIEAWTLTIQGNTGTYAGTGPDIGAHCVFNPPVINPDQYLPSCVILGNAAVTGTVVSTITDADLGMSE